MEKEIKRFYFLMISPAVSCFVLLYVLEKQAVWVPVGENSPVLTILLVFLAGFFALALPLWIRVLFIRRVRTQQGVTPAMFVSFEKMIIFCAELALYVILAAQCFQINRMAMVVVALFGFYAAYYYFPSSRRIGFEKTLFRVQADS